MHIHNFGIKEILTKNIKKEESKQSLVSVIMMKGKKRKKNKQVD